MTPGHSTSSDFNYQEAYRAMLVEFGVTEGEIAERAARYSQHEIDSGTADRKPMTAKLEMPTPGKLKSTGFAFPIRRPPPE